MNSDTQTVRHRGRTPRHGEREAAISILKDVQIGPISSAIPQDMISGDYWSVLREIVIEASVLVRLQRMSRRR